jgi:hypothetical protein
LHFDERFDVISVCEAKARPRPNRNDFRPEELAVTNEWSEPLKEQPFARFGALCALAAGPVGFGYSLAFVLSLHSPSRGAAYADDLLLLTGGLLSTAVFTALYERLRATDPGLALWGLVLALVGAFGAVLHGGYDLANLVNPPAGLATDVPNAVDPRGLGTFGLTALALAATGLLIVRGRRLPIGLGYLAFVSAALLAFVYVGRMVILNPKSPGLLTAAVIVGFLVNPVWFVWLGLVLRRTGRHEAVTLGP